MVITHGESKFTYNLHKTGWEPQRKLWCRLSPKEPHEGKLKHESTAEAFLEREITNSSCQQKLRGIHRRLISLENVVSAEQERIKMTRKAKRWAGRPKGARVVSSCSFFLLPAALLSTEALKVRSLYIILGPLAKEMPICPRSYGGVSEQEWCKKLHLSHSQLTAEALSKVLPIVMVSATSLSSLFSLPHVYTPSRWLCSPDNLQSYWSPCSGGVRTSQSSRVGPEGQSVLCSPDRSSSSKVWPDLEAKSSEDHPEQLSGIFKDLPLSHLHRCAKGKDQNWDHQGLILHPLAGQFVFTSAEFLTIALQNSHL